MKKSEFEKADPYDALVDSSEVNTLPGDGRRMSDLPPRGAPQEI